MIVMEYHVALLAHDNFQCVSVSVYGGELPCCHNPGELFLVGLDKKIAELQYSKEGVRAGQLNSMNFHMVHGLSKLAREDMWRVQRWMNRVVTKRCIA